MADLTINISIPEAMGERLQTAICHNFGYQALIPTPNWVFDPAKPDIKMAPMINNPEKPKAFCIRIIKQEFLREQIVKYEVNQERRNLAKNKQREVEEALS